MAQNFFILGCGKMGGAMLAGWLSHPDLGDTRFIIIDPFFKAEGALAGHPQIESFQGLAEAVDAGHARPDIMLLSVKPQMMAEALEKARRLSCDQTLFISIAAGLSIEMLANMLPEAPQRRIIRAMPNTPAAIGKGMTALIGNAHITADDLQFAERLMKVSGAVALLDDEAQMDAVTALSGSGPAYIFLMAEAMMQAGVELGLTEEVARQLADQTVYGAANLLHESDENAANLRENVTSKGGTTAAALGVLMAEDGLAELMKRALRAAHDRSVELGS